MNRTSVLIVKLSCICVRVEKYEVKLLNIWVNKMGVNVIFELPEFKSVFINIKS